MEITFNTIIPKNSLANTVFLQIEYMHGDGDFYETDDIDLNIPFSNTITIPDEYIQPWKDLQDILENRYDLNYDSVLDQWGEDMADMYDNVPRDKATDGQICCSLSSIRIIGYDSNCNEFIAYIN